MGQQIYTTGSGNFTVPAGVTSLSVKIIGGGGGGVGGIGGGKGGGGGGCAVHPTYAATPGGTIAYSVAALASTGLNGNTTTFGTLTANGGAAGNAGGGPVGGTASGGTDNYTGGDGGSDDTAGGGGGSSAGFSSNGTAGGNASGSTPGTGATAPTGGGNGGNGANLDDGSDGSAPGGGGGGGSGGSTVGGSGARGYIQIDWTDPGFADWVVPPAKPFGQYGELLSMLKNTAGQKIGSQMITAADGSAFTGSVSVAVTIDAGTQAAGTVGSGACTHEGNGYHTYAPSQAETNGDLVAFTFTGTGAVPATVQVATQTSGGGGDLTSILGTALTETSAGYLAAAFKKLFDVATPVLTAASVNQTGDAYGVANTRLPAALTGGGNMKCDALAISGDTGAADNAEAFFDGTGYAGTNNVIPLVTTTTNLTNAPSAGDFTATMKTSLNAATPSVSGTVTANVTQWNGTNVASPATAGIPEVNVKNWNNLAAVALPLVPTTAGRTLDVSATGEAGIDWANVGSPTTTLNLSGTTIKTATDVATATTAIKAKTDQLTFTVANQVDANALTAVGATVAKLGVAFTSSAGTEVRFSAWLEQNGQAVVLASGDCTITLRENGAGSDLFTVTSSSVDANGVFSITKSTPGFTADRVYVAIVEIDDGVDVWTNYHPVPVFG